GDAISWRHFRHSVEQLHNLFLVVKRQRGEQRTSQCILQHLMKWLRRHHRYWRCQKWMFLASIYGLSNDGFSGLAQQVLFGYPSNLHRDGNATDTFHHAMIEKWDTPLNRMSHFHTVA